MAASRNQPAPDESRDLEICASEPIHVPGAIQPHGALVVLDAETLAVTGSSANASLLLDVEVSGEDLLTRLSQGLDDAIRAWVRTPERIYQGAFALAGGMAHVTAHRTQSDIIVEFERLSQADEETIARIFPKLKTFSERIGAEESVAGCAAIAAGFVRELTGFNRVLVYRFDQEWNGHVVGEDGDGTLPSYLDLRFPAGDIPAQARELYRLNRLRIIPDVDYEPVPVELARERPLDMSFSTLRSVSPVHLEYMRNMGTTASMSVSIIVDGVLWGLVSCHSRGAHRVSINIRNACDFAVQSLSTVLAARQRASQAAERVELGALQARLLSAMSAADDWRAGIASAEELVLGLFRATGAALILDGHFQSWGNAPDEENAREIVAWLEKNGEDEVTATDNLPGRMPDAAHLSGIASGLLAIRISELHPGWLLWFRPEIVRTVEWGGDPHKYVREEGRIHPRVSFERWKEQVGMHSAPWRQAEVAAAEDLRSAIMGIVLRRAEEKAQLTEELQRSNKELEAFSYSISHDLRAPFRHIVGYSELLRQRENELDEKSRHYLDSISESAVAAGRLVDDLLNFSQIGRAALARKTVDMNKIVIEVRRSLELGAKDRRIDWNFGHLPLAWCDVSLVRQVWYNLMENAVKYTRTRDLARIAVSGWQEDGKVVYRVEDNGVGFDMAYLQKLFGVFQRLQREEDFEGTGIGLALAKRIIDRHGGRIWAEGEVDKGALFTFSLPARMEGAD